MYDKSRTSNFLGRPPFCLKSLSSMRMMKAMLTPQLWVPKSSSLSSLAVRAINLIVSGIDSPCRVGQGEILM